MATKSYCAPVSTNTSCLWYSVWGFLDENHWSQWRGHVHDYDEPAKLEQAKLTICDSTEDYVQSTEKLTVWHGRTRLVEIPSSHLPTTYQRVTSQYTHLKTMVLMEN